jgi:hypothetical protein
MGTCLSNIVAAAAMSAASDELTGSFCIVDWSFILLPSSKGDMGAAEPRFKRQARIRKYYMNFAPF